MTGTACGKLSRERGKCQTRAGPHVKMHGSLMSEKEYANDPGQEGAVSNIAVIPEVFNFTAYKVTTERQ